MTKLAILKKLFIILTSFHFLQTLKVIIHFLKKGIFKHRNVRLFFSSISKHSSILKSEWRTVCYFFPPAPGLNQPSKDLLHYFDLARMTYYFQYTVKKLNEWANASLMTLKDNAKSWRNTHAKIQAGNHLTILQLCRKGHRVQV